MNEFFYELIRVAIGTQDTLSRLPSAEEWKTLYNIANKQSLIGVSFAALHRLGADADEGFARIGINEMLYLTWMGMAAKIQQKNEVVNRLCVELQARLAVDGFRSCLLKGQGNIINYGTIGLLRQSGDIDLWVEGGYERISTYVQAKAPTKDINQHHANFSVCQDTDVELHFYPLKLNNPLKQRVLNKFCDSIFVDEFNHVISIAEGVNIRASSNAFNLVFQMMHIYHHLFTEGVGLRQLMDYYFVLKTSTTKERTDCISHLEELGVLRFASAMMWVMEHVFGLPQNLMIVETNQEDGMFLLKEVMMAGNFGHHDERVPKNMNYWKSFWYLNFYNLRLIRFDCWSWFWTPISRINGFLWRKRKGFI